MNMVVVNCTTFFCQWLHLGFQFNCPLYLKDCSPCKQEKCVLGNEVKENCFEWICKAYVTTTEAPVTTPYPPVPPKLSFASAFFTTCAVLCACIVLLILYKKRRDFQRLLVWLRCPWQQAPLAFLTDEINDNVEERRDDIMLEEISCWRSCNLWRWPRQEQHPDMINQQEVNEEPEENNDHARSTLINGNFEDVQI